MSCHYTAAVKCNWLNRNDVVVKSMKEEKIVLEAAYILFYKQMCGCLETEMSDKAFG